VRGDDVSEELGGRETLVWVFIDGDRPIIILVGDDLLE
jgi:hypothetical protein